MSFGELMFHIAGSNAFRFAQTGQTKIPLEAPKDRSKASALKALAESFNFCEKMLRGLTGEQLDRIHKVDWYGMPEEAEPDSLRQAPPSR